MQMQSHKCLACPKLDEHFADMKQRDDLQQRIEQTAHSLSDRNLSLIQVFDAKLELLRRLQYINDYNMLELKVCSRGC